MTKAQIFFNARPAGVLVELERGKRYRFEYNVDYQGLPISLTMPVENKVYEFDIFPPFFDGLLPEGPQLEALLKEGKFDRNDYLGQLIAVGNDLVGAVSVKAMPILESDI